MIQISLSEIKVFNVVDIVMWSCWRRLWKKMKGDDVWMESAFRYELLARRKARSRETCLFCTRNNLRKRFSTRRAGKVVGEREREMGSWPLGLMRAPTA